VLLRYRRHERSLPSDVPISADRWSWQWICGGRDGNIVAYLTKADSDAWESAQKAKAARLDADADADADADGWIEWHGGECPVAPGTLTEVKFRAGYIDCDNSPEFWRWSHINDHGDIIAYRVVKEAKSDADAREAAQKAKAATVDPELIDALNEFARLGKDTDADRPLAVGDLVKHVAPGSPVMRVWLLSNDNSASVEWWVGNELKVCRFELSDLVRVPNE
jgi:hypothetical protein